jgi:hypothetical protein
MAKSAPKKASHVTSAGDFRNSAKVAKAQKPKPAKVRKSTSDIFGPDAPSRLLRMAQTGNQLAIEILVYLPNSIRSHDVVRRLVENGGNPLAIGKILNFYRQSTKGQGTVVNSLRKGLQNTMREYGLPKWTVGKHQAGDFQAMYEGGLDHNNLTLTGCRPHCEDFVSLARHGGPALENTPYTSLANNLVLFPIEQDGDGLDLTLSVKLAVANPQHHFLFPRDFDFLVNLRGGPQPIRGDNLDRAAFQRWDSASSAIKPTQQQIRDANNLADYVFTDVEKQEVIRYLNNVAAEERAAQPTDTTKTGKAAQTNRAKKSRRADPPAPMGLLPQDGQNLPLPGIADVDADGDRWVHEPVLTDEEFLQDDMAFTKSYVYVPEQNAAAERMDGVVGYIGLQSFNQDFNPGPVGVTGGYHNGDMHSTAYSSWQHPAFSEGSMPTSVSTPQNAETNFTASMDPATGLNPNSYGYTPDHNYYLQGLGSHVPEIGHGEACSQDSLTDAEYSLPFGY